MDYQTFHRRSIDDRDAFWAEQAQLIDWHRPFDQVCDYGRPPFANWFVGGQTNLCHNAIDRHLATRADQRALIYVSTEIDREQIYSFRELHAEVQCMAAILLGAGRRAGRSRVDLHADDPGSGVRDARVCAHRRDPLGGVRWLREREPGEPHRRRDAEGDRVRPTPAAAAARCVRLQAVAR